MNGSPIHNNIISIIISLKEFIEIVIYPLLNNPIKKIEYNKTSAPNENAIKMHLQITLNRLMSFHSIFSVS